jgi:hypothetical protein
VRQGCQHVPLMYCVNCSGNLPADTLANGTYPCNECEGSYSVERDDAGTGLVVADSCSQHCRHHGKLGDEHGGAA